VLVGSRETYATERVADTGEVAALLEWLTATAVSSAT
jgi:hypothetical protein